MGIIKDGILGSVSGSVGPVVLCTYRTQEVVKTKPKKSSKPPVQSQIDQRSKFKLVTEFLSSIPEVINSGDKSGKKTSSPMNRAVQYLLDNAITGVSPDFTLDYSKVKLSGSNLATIMDTEVVSVASRSLVLTWGSSEDLDPAVKALRDTDQAMIVFFGDTTRMFYDASGIVTRGEGGYTVKFHPTLLKDTIHGWMFFLSADKKTVFKSTYLGEFKLIA